MGLNIDQKHLEFSFGTGQPEENLLVAPGVNWQNPSPVSLVVLKNWPVHEIVKTTFCRRIMQMLQPLFVWLFGCWKISGICKQSLSASCYHIILAEVRNVWESYFSQFQPVSNPYGVSSNKSKKRERIRSFDPARVKLHFDGFSFQFSSLQKKPGLKNSNEFFFANKNQIFW